MDQYGSGLPYEMNPRTLCSTDGETLYAFAREGSSGPGTVWATPLGEEPDWQPVVEDVSPIPAFGGDVMIFPTE